MSQPVIISTPTTITSNSIRFSYGYLRTTSGMLKIGELILGSITVGCVTPSWNLPTSIILFFLLMATTFTIGTFCLLFSYIITLGNSKPTSETMFELIYHLIASIFLFVASITLASGYTNYYYMENATVAAAVIGSLNAILYFLSAHFAYRGLVDVQPASGYYNSNTDFSSTIKTVNQDNTRYF